MVPTAGSGRPADPPEEPLLHRLAVGATLIAVAGVVTALCVAVAWIVRPDAADAAPHRVADGPASSDVYLRGCGGSATQQPMTVAGWCASGDDLYSNLQWTSWGGRSAVAVGTYFRNSCDCAGGRIERYPVRMTLSAPRGDRGALRWTRARVAYPARRPQGAPPVERFRLTTAGLVRVSAP